MNTLVSADALKKEELSCSAAVNSSSKIIVSCSSGFDLRVAGMVSNKLFSTGSIQFTTIPKSNAKPS